MKMSKILSLLMTLTMAVTVLVGCGQTTNKIEGDHSAVIVEKQETLKEEGEEQEIPKEEGEEQEPSVEEIEEQGVEEEVVGEVDPTPADEAYFVSVDGIEMPASMKADETMLIDAYGIDPSILASYHVEMGMNRAVVSEVAVFEVKNEADHIATVKAGIEKRQQSLDEQWSRYLEDQYEIVKNAQTIVNGNMVIYVVSENAEQIINQFNSLQ